MAKYIDLYPNSITGGNGLIALLSVNDAIPWNVLTLEQKQDIERTYGVRSGSKTISTAFSLSDDEAKARILATMFAQKWTKLWNDFSIEYNPLDAYSLTETGTKKKDITDKDIAKYGRTVTENGTDTGTVSMEGTDTSIVDAGIYGFNSSDPVHANKDTNATNTSDTETRDLATSRSLTNAGQDERDKTGNENEEYSYTKKGNIGYTTPQNLLMQEFELWKTPFFNIVFEDIDSFITVMVYD